MRAGRQQPDTHPASHPRPAGLVPSHGGGGLLDVAHQVGIERLAAAVGPHGLAAEHQAAAPELQRVQAGAPGHLVDL